jgi:hypothetical protein
MESSSTQTPENPQVDDVPLQQTPEELREVLQTINADINKARAAGLPLALGALVSAGVVYAVATLVAPVVVPVLANALFHGAGLFTARGAAALFLMAASAAASLVVYFTVSGLVLLPVFAAIGRALTKIHEGTANADIKRWARDQMDYLIRIPSAQCWTTERAMETSLSELGTGESLGAALPTTLAGFVLCTNFTGGGLRIAESLIAAVAYWFMLAWIIKQIGYRGVDIAYSFTSDWVYERAIELPAALSKARGAFTAAGKVAMVAALFMGGWGVSTSVAKDDAQIASTAQRVHAVAKTHDVVKGLAALERSEKDTAAEFGVYSAEVMATASGTPWVDSDCQTTATAMSTLNDPPVAIVTVCAHSTRVATAVRAALHPLALTQVDVQHLQASAP